MNGKIVVDITDEDPRMEIIKTFGTCQISQSRRSVTFSIPQLIAGASRDFVIVIGIPKAEKMLQDFQKNKVIAEGKFFVEKLLNNKKEEKNQCNLKL